MGIAGSDIILMDDNVTSIVKAIMRGRCTNDIVRKFLQFQISTTITVVMVTFVSAVASNKEAPVLTAVQLFWTNIIVDTFAAPALATNPATKAPFDRTPDTRGARWGRTRIPAHEWYFPGSRLRLYPPRVLIRCIPTHRSRAHSSSRVGSRESQGRVGRFVSRAVFHNNLFPTHGVTQTFAYDY